MGTLSLAQARRLAVWKQLLAGNRPPATREGILRVFDALGCVQIDPIRAVERTQYLVLWSRLGNFAPELLDRLQWDEKCLFEDWAHAASIVKVADYPLFHALAEGRRRSRNKGWQMTQEWARSNPKLVQHVREKLVGSEPLAPQDFDDGLAENPWEPGRWRSGRSVTRVLDMLFWRGEIVVAGRTPTGKLWQRAQDWLPEWADQSRLSDLEITRRGLPTAVKALGVGSAGQIFNHFLRKKYPQFESVLGQLQRDGEVLPVQVEGMDETWYMHRDDVPLLERLDGAEWQPRTVFLSPFDNLICDRQRTEQLFGFHYRIEIYVPAAKRRYGYYVMPILRGEELVGRMDSQLDRKTGQYRVNALYVEEEAFATLQMGAAIADSLAELADFIGAGSLALGSEIPRSWREPLCNQETLARLLSG